MARYILKRILWMIPIILGVAILVFTIMYFCPGDPASVIAGANATEQAKEEIRQTLGLNQGYFQRLFTYLSDVFLHFDLGTSYITKAPIAAEIMARLPRTALLAFMCMVLSILLGVPLGIVAAIHQDRVADRASMIAALFGTCMPPFWLALLMILLFSVKLGWLPALGVGSFKHYIMPTIALSLQSVAYQARQSRSSMLEVIRSDYVTTARSKGVSNMNVIVRHELTNALIPIITLAGNQFSTLLGGAMIIEQIFSIPGMGTLIVQGIFNRDYPVVQAGAVVLAVLFSIIMLLVDLIYAFVDPRIKAQYEGKPLFKKKQR